MADIQLSDPSGVPADDALLIGFNNRVLRTIFTTQKLQLPSGGPGLCWGTGAPTRVDVVNGDFYFRVDGGAGTCVYQRRVGVWVATGA